MVKAKTIENKNLTLRREAAINEFRVCCLEASQHSSHPFREVRFDDFISQGILPDSLLSQCFVLTYPVARKLRREDLCALLSLKKSQSHLADKFHELHKNWSPYSNIFHEDFVTIWTTLRKINAGDKRSIAKIYEDSIPKKHTIKSKKATTHFTIFRQQPVLPDSVLRNIKYNTKAGPKWVGEIHFFGVTKDAIQLSENINHLLMLRRFSETYQVLPQKSHPEYLVCYHSDSLPTQVSSEQVMMLCDRAQGVPLAWGPKFINLIRQEIFYARDMGIEFDLKDRDDFDPPASHYPPQYWFLLEHINHLENEVSYLFLGTIEKLSQKQNVAIEAIPRWIETVLKRKVSKFVKREKKKILNKEKRSGPEPRFEDLYVEKDKDVEERFLGRVVTEFEEFDLKEIFSDPTRLYIAQNLGKKNLTKDAAKRFGKSERRIQQIRKEISEILDTEEKERLTYVNLFRDHVESVRALLYKKPYYRYPDSKDKVVLPEKAEL